MPTWLAIYFSTVLRVQFAAATYSGLESSGQILVSIIIASGRNPIATVSATITFSEVSATGQLLVIHVLASIYNILIIGSDFNTSSINITIPAGATYTTVSVVVIDDDIVEGDETFDMNLHVPSSLAPAVITGSVTNATGIIADTTSKQYD